jgi:hypothetical protein
MPEARMTDSEVKWIERRLAALPPSVTDSLEQEIVWNLIGAFGYLLNNGIASRAERSAAREFFARVSVIIEKREKRIANPAVTITVP